MRRGISDELIRLVTPQISDAGAVPPQLFLENFFDELRRKVPVGK